MTQETTTADEAQTETETETEFTPEYTVEVDCDCPNCGSDNTATQEHTAEMFDDDSGYASKCKDCGFHFRAFGLADDDEEEEIDIEDVEEGQKVTVRYDMTRDGHTHEVKTEIDRIEDDDFDHERVIVTLDDGREIALRNISKTVEIGGDTIAKDVRILAGH